MGIVAEQEIFIPIRCSTGDSSPTEIATNLPTISCAKETDALDNTLIITHLGKADSTRPCAPRQRVREASIAPLLQYKPGGLLERLRFTRWLAALLTPAKTA